MNRLAAAPTAFRFRAARADGSIVAGSLSETDPDAVRARLRERGLHPISVRSAVRWRWRRPPSRRQLAVAVRSLADLVGAGIPLERALQATIGLSQGRVAEGLGAARQAIRDGATFSEGLEREAGVFPRSAVGLVRAGERGSTLDAALSAAADQLESEAELAGRLRGALAYPLLVLAVALGSVLVLGLVVVPRFAELIQGSGGVLPTSTRAILGVSAGLARWGWIGLVAFVPIVVIWRSGRLERRFNREIHRMLLRAPVVGRIRRGLASARICQVLSGTLAGGMPLLEAVAVAEEATADLELRARMHAVRERLRRGEAFATALEEEDAMDPAAVQLLRVGEASGRVGELAGRAANVLLGEARRSIEAAVGLLEPALVVILGSGVAFMAAALLRAVYSVRPGG